MAAIRIDIASEFKDKGFKNAQRSTDKLNRSFANLRRTATRTFIAIAGFRALRASVNAFAAEDKAAVKLAQSLRNLGLAYNTKAIEDYLEKSEKATAISKDELSPAITQLITTTLDANKSMKLLSVAMDISASTGKDLGSVTTALSRAFNGNYASLGKLQTAYTAAELEAMGFDRAISTLSEQFAGSAASAAGTYSGKIDLLKIAFGDAAEELGKGIIGGLEQLNNGNYTTGLEAIVKVGSAIGDVFRRAGLTIRYTKELLSTGFRIDEEERRRLEELRTLFDNPNAVTNRVANNPAANRRFLADTRKQQALQKKIEEDRKKATALAAKAEKERLKREKEALQLKRAGSIFDMENIQIVAALQGKIDGEQRLRLVALLALNNGIAEAAEKASTAVLAINAPALASLGVIIEAGDKIEDVIGKLINAQARTALVDLGIKNIPKAKNPFEDWDSILKKIIFDLDAIAAKIRNMPTVSANGAITSGNATGGGATGGGATGGNATGGGTFNVPNPFNPSSPAISTSTIADQIGTLTALRATTESGTAINFLLKEHIDTLANATTLSSLNALGDEQARMRAMGMFDTPGITAGSLFDPSRFRRADEGGTNVTVIVEGSVISQQDLTEAITDQLYLYQKSGKGILYDSVSI
jgi:hypothetical protein